MSLSGNADPLPAIPLPSWPGIKPEWAKGIAWERGMEEGAGRLAGVGGQLSLWLDCTPLDKADCPPEQLTSSSSCKEGPRTKPPPQPHTHGCPGMLPFQPVAKLAGLVHVIAAFRPLPGYGHAVGVFREGLDHPEDRRVQLDWSETGSEQSLQAGRRPCPALPCSALPLPPPAAPSLSRVGSLQPSATATGKSLITANQQERDTDRGRSQLRQPT